MTEHAIRLRGGWICRAAGSAESEERRRVLPFRWGADEPRRLVLTRRFGRPPMDARRQVLLLRMDHVKGILSVTLNGLPIPSISAEKCRYEIELTGLSARNVLEVSAQAPEHRSGSDRMTDLWGLITLVVRTIDPTETS